MIDTLPCILLSQRIQENDSIYTKSYKMTAISSHGSCLNSPVLDLLCFFVGSYAEKQKSDAMLEELLLPMLKKVS